MVAKDGIIGQILVGVVTAAIVGPGGYVAALMPAPDIPPSAAMPAIAFGEWKDDLPTSLNILIGF